jgi:alkylated DNA repair dioxygenase AlkB
MVKLCQRLGVGPGGFYRPGYKDGAKLSLQMMCLGMNWDPDSNSYGYTRSFDGAQPPNIPEEFRNFVLDAIKVSHELLEKSMGVANVMEELPPMSPDICIVNFYGTSGKLGLHQVQSITFSNITDTCITILHSCWECSSV